VTYLLVAFLLVVVVPLFIATWRTSLVGLGLQGLLLTAMVAQRGWHPSPSAVVLLLDLLVLRAWFVPRHLYGILIRQGRPRRNDPIPANMLSWTLAGALVIGAFHFASLVVPEGGVAETHVAVAAASLLLALLVLASEDTLLAQVTGALRIENAIALFELSAEHALPLPLQLGVTGILVATVLLFGRFLRQAHGGVLEEREP
jgi:hydrogenase-4 membrane subunit HyfE